MTVQSLGKALPMDVAPRRSARCTCGETVVAPLGMGVHEFIKQVRDLGWSIDLAMPTGTGSCPSCH